MAGEFHVVCSVSAILFVVHYFFRKALGYKKDFRPNLTNQAGLPLSDLHCYYIQLCCVGYLIKFYSLQSSFIFNVKSTCDIGYDPKSDAGWHYIEIFSPLSARRSSFYPVQAS